MFGKVLKLSLSAVLAAVVTGCSLFAPSTQIVSISGQPAGAIVMVNGNTVVAPAQVAIKPHRPLSITVSKEGYQTTMLSSNCTLSTFGVLDLVGGFFLLVPWVGLLAPGAFTLDNQNFTYHLIPVK
ncbi:MAG: PEGA domain-containing protein [Lentisphaerae bacterium]|nr:PEGA domain-containing protein [Lentisphaerota bacterium]